MTTTRCKCGKTEIDPALPTGARTPIVATPTRWHRADECTLRFTLHDLLETILDSKLGPEAAIRTPMHEDSGALPSAEDLATGLDELGRRGLVRRRTLYIRDGETVPSPVAHIEPLVSSMAEAKQHEDDAGRRLDVFVE